MTVFVADLGLKLGQREFLFKESGNSKLNCGPAANASAPPLQDSNAVTASGTAGSKGNNDPQGYGSSKLTATPGNTSEKPIVWRELEKSRALVSTEREAEDFLKTVRLENFFSVIKSAIPVGSDGLNMLSGTFKGKLIFFDGNQKPKDVTLILSSSGQGASSTGKYELIISNGEQKESHTKGEGGFKHFNGLGDGSAGVLIRFTPDSYVQMYSSDRYNGLFGNYYTQESIDKFGPTGTMWLHR